MKPKTMVLFACLSLGGGQLVLAQDPVQQSPSMYKVLLENEHVRVLEFRAKVGETEPMHSHAGMVLYILSSGRAKFTMPDGTYEIRESVAGTAMWSEPVTHAYEQLGPGEGHVLIIEMKDGHQ